MKRNQLTANCLFVVFVTPPTTDNEQSIVKLRSMVLPGFYRAAWNADTAHGLAMRILPICLSVRHTREL